MRKPITEEQMAREIRRAKRFIDTAFALTVLLAIVITIALLCFHWQHSFSSKRWKNHPQQRGDMVYSLLTQNKLYGMQRAEVTDLLGYDQHYSYSAEPDQLTYYLGAVTDPAGDRWLILKLENDAVESYSIRTK